MGREIERKFLLKSDVWRTLAQGILYRQGYLCDDRERTVRVRTVGKRAFLAVKSSGAGITRVEFEYEIPFDDASAMLDNLVKKPLIEKKRYTIRHMGLTWEIDEFFGKNAGLIVAEVELENEDQPIDKPVWAGKEVTGDPRYFNSSLVSYPFSAWRDGKEESA